MQLCRSRRNSSTHSYTRKNPGSKTLFVIRLIDTNEPDYFESFLAAGFLIRSVEGGASMVSDHRE
jgi:hypothetical protein